MNECRNRFATIRGARATRRESRCAIRRRCCGVALFRERTVRAALYSAARHRSRYRQGILYSVNRLAASQLSPSPSQHSAFAPRCPSSIHFLRSKHYTTTTHRPIYIYVVHQQTAVLCGVFATRYVRCIYASPPYIARHALGLLENEFRGILALVDFLCVCVFDGISCAHYYIRVLMCFQMQTHDVIA